jgi:hypothetical protein
VEEQMGGRDSREEELVNYEEAELIEPSLKWTAALRDGGCRFFGNI